MLKGEEQLKKKKRRKKKRAATKCKFNTAALLHIWKILIAP